MGEGPSLLVTDTDTSPNMHQQQSYDANPVVAWAATADAASLAATNLPLPRPHRAWDRRPQSPFSRKKVRFGKVWKRSGTANTKATTLAGSLTSAHHFELVDGSTESPMRAIKRVRVDRDGTDFVRDWEGRGSPPRNRRIVTRSTSGEDTQSLLELAEEDGTEESVNQPQENGEWEELIKVEIHNEDGSVEKIGLQEELAQDEWEDESATEEDPDGLDELMRQRELDRRRAEDETKTLAGAIEQPDVSTEPGYTIASPKAAEREDEQHPTPIVEIPSPKPHRVLAAPTNAIPEGFVSPPRRKQRRSIGQVQARADRRRTLPASFVAQNLGLASAVEESATSQQQTPCLQFRSEYPETDEVPMAYSLNEPVVATEKSSTPEKAEGPAITEPHDTEQGAVADSSCSASNTPGDPPVACELVDSNEWVTTAENTATSSGSASVVTRVAEEPENARARSIKSPPSPVGSVKGQHPGLPLRRSPRRQSSSPLKRSITIPPQGKPHFVAFTPIKLRAPTTIAAWSSPVSSTPPPALELLQPEDVSENPVVHCVRSSSAPPEEPQMSPRKPAQPRISDDTAILQAFLSRAAEDRVDRHISITARRESLENRRESGTVRKALASPDEERPATVLGDLDPNSPSPRKQSAANDQSMFDLKLQSVHDEDELASQSPVVRTTRRSGRAKNKAQVLLATTPSGPTKISVRGVADSVILKKTHAQELSQLTRTNTRKNKGGAVPPRLKLTKMAKEDIDSIGLEDDIGMEPERLSKVKWSETLESYQQSAGPEMSMTTDELDGPEPVSEECTEHLDIDMVGVVRAPVPSGTPSRPRLRRLKPPRTASTPARVAPQLDVQVDQEETLAEPVMELKPKTTRRRSRIATPAKPKDGLVSSLLPDGIEQQGEPNAASLPARKKLTSKLPAPAPVSAGLAQGKAGFFIASPPKKRIRPVASSSSVPSSKSFTPKLELARPERRGTDLAIASPAKKGVKIAGGQEALPATLGSPAKKRTRRGVT